jgi:hypothetical protein
VRTAPRDSARDSVKIQIVDAGGKVVRTITQLPAAGVNRVWWDLRSEPTPEAKLRTSPLYAAWLPVQPEGTPAPGIGRFSLLAPPGRYTVRLLAGGKTSEQPLDVLKDPNTGASDDDLRAQGVAMDAVLADLDSTVAMINRVELLRGQLASLRATLAGDSTAADVRARADTLDRTLRAFEEDLFQVKVTGRGQDLLRWPMKLAEQLMYLAQSITSSDFAPTGPQRAVQQLLSGQVREGRTRLDRLMAGDVATFRQQLRSRNLPTLIP